MDTGDARVGTFLEAVRREFAIDLTAARALVGRFHADMRAGLDGRGGSLKMLPSFTRLPAGTERGRFLALDLGGTNFRVMAVELSGARSFRILHATRAAIPRAVMEGEGTALFDFLAAAVEGFLGEAGMPRGGPLGLGFTFSFPVRQSGIKSGTLIQWTKGFTARGVVGEDVVRLLEEALRRRGVAGIAVRALVNDTVGTLVAHGYETRGCAAGVILGTGTNACYPEPSRDGMIVNMEWGGFDGHPGNAWDGVVDAASPNPGAQRFEKAVSGMYLGELARLVLARMAAEGLRDAPAGAPGSLSGEDLSRLVTGSDPAARTVAGLVADRSARLAATAIAAVIAWQGAAPAPAAPAPETAAPGPVVAVDGSLFEKFPGYRETLAAFLAELLGDLARDAGAGLAAGVPADLARPVRLDLARDGSGVGAAIVAAVASGANPGANP